MSLHLPDSPDSNVPRHALPGKREDERPKLTARAKSFPVVRERFLYSRRGISLPHLPDDEAESTRFTG
jgi:hypothetical protein